MFLPKDIVVQESYEVLPDFHPRYCNSEKTYEYKIYNNRVNNPLLGRYMHFVYQNLDVTKMQEAAKYLVGTHDFTSFCNIKTQTKTTVRTIYSLDVKQSDQVITIRVTGNGFLYNMVRIIAGVVIRVGTGKYTPDYVDVLLNQCLRTNELPTAPPQGLTLIHINYIDNIRLEHSK